MYESRTCVKFTDAGAAMFARSKMEPGKQE
jgi:hypothetical protein